MDAAGIDGQVLSLTMPFLGSLPPGAEDKAKIAHRNAERVLRM